MLFDVYYVVGYFNIINALLPDWKNPNILQVFIIYKKKKIITSLVTMHIFQFYYQLHVCCWDYVFT